MKENERIYTLDICKVFGIILVVFGHFLPSGNIIKIIIYSFHVPLFFVISGAVLNINLSFKNFLFKRIKQLIIPDIFFTIISLPAYLFLVKDTHQNIIRRIFFLHGDVIWNSPLWFLVVLFSVEIIFMILIKLTSKNLLILFSLISLILCYLMYIKGVHVYFGIEKIILLFPFYCIGYLLKNNTKFFEKDKSVKVTIISVICFLTSTIIVVLFNSNDNISILGFCLNNYWTYIFNAVIEVVSLMYIIKSIKNSTFFRVAIKYTLKIMCTHYFICLMWLENTKPTLLMYIR